MAVHSCVARADGLGREVSQPHPVQGVSQLDIQMFHRKKEKIQMLISSVV